MKKTVLLLLTFGLAQALFCQKTITQKLDELMAAYCKVNKFNGSVLVSRCGKILLEKGYGIKNARTNTPNDPHSIFQIYSITKTFTSTVILKLVEEGKLSLSDKLSKFYPGFPKGDSITIEYLLTHTSGIYDYTRGNNMPDQTERSFMNFIETRPLDFSPGTGWNYSNSGYWLLGFIIKKVTGMAYEEAVKKYILKSLHMNRSGFDFKNLSDTNKTTGYAIFSDHKKKEAVVYESPGPFAAGAIYATVGDLYKFHKGLQNFTIIKEASLKKAYTPFRNNYGYGWIIGSFEGKQIVSHSGGAAGFRSNFLRIPEDDICIILLNNTENAFVDLITKNLLNILFDKPYKMPVEIKLDTSVLAQFTGAFFVRPSLTMYITIEDGRLAAQGSKQRKTVLLAEKENYFFAEEANGFLEFTKDEKGNYSELVMHQGQQMIKAKRIYPTWGLTGTATAKGWDENTPDIQFTQDSLTKGLWVLKDITLKSGLMVFRLNNDWGYHYGNNENDKVLDMYGKDIEVEAGTYDIILDLRNEMEPAYTILKTSRGQ
jgi:CubicO group peptidase (beta-lactamase class C family)